MKQASALNVELQNGLPCQVDGKSVSHLVDRYRLWPHWWEGYAPRDYWLLDAEGKTLLVYFSEGCWFHASTLD